MNINTEEVIMEHIKYKADITILAHDNVTTTSRRLVLDVDGNNRVTDMLISEMPDTTVKKIALNTYIIHKSLLSDLIENAYARGFIDFEKDILLKKVKDLKIMCYNIKQHATIIDDIKSYYYESMNCLKPNIKNELFYGYGTIFTKVKDSDPTIYRANAEVNNSLIADGCDIDGIVENSILFRGVKVKKGAVIKNSIIMENGIIGENSSVAYAITDKNVNVRENRNLSGYETYPIVIVKDKVV
jgi:glucose-1-phosphate adenylyltransferase